MSEAYKCDVCGGLYEFTEGAVRVHGVTVCPKGSWDDIDLCSTCGAKMNELSVMDGTGDTKTIWDPDNKDEVAAARKQFDDLRTKGFLIYTVKRDGVTKDITATLGKMPDDVYQAMVDGHMKEHVAVAAK